MVLLAMVWGKALGEGTGEPLEEIVASVQFGEDYSDASTSTDEVEGAVA